LAIKGSGKTEWQWHYLTNDYVESATNSDTLRIKLPEREQISCIELECYATRARGEYDQTILDIIKRIEVIADGASVLYSCIPETAEFLHFTQIRSIPNSLWATYPAWADHFRVKICFGRWERDEDYMLDTGVYNNVYLEVPWELNTYYYDTHTFTHTVRYLRPIQRLSPVGFIRSRDIEYGTHVWTAVGHYYVDLPLKYPWYMVGCRIYDIDEDLVNDIPHIILDIDDGRLVLVDDDTDDLMTSNDERLPYPVHTMWKKLCSGGADQYAETFLGRTKEVSALAYVTDTPIFVTLEELLSGQRVKYNTFDHAGVACPSGVNMSMWGEAYMCCLIIKDWWLNWYEPVPHAPFPVGEHSMARIDYTHGAYTVTDLRTFLQEICPLKI